jgi:regulation of enolase protein 1 (concanavalin A-like superfamily)
MNNINLKTSLLSAFCLFAGLSATAQSLSTMHWLNAPKKSLVAGNKLQVQVEGGTDFWRVTHYGFIRDNGHFYYLEQEGDFVAKVKVVGHYQELYDQAGLMVRLDEKNWIKTGIEYVKGVQNVSAVVTREVSDWSVVPRQDSPAAVWLTLLRKGDFVEIQYSFDNKDFKMLRLAYFPPTPGRKVQIGLMCAAPDGKGFPVEFEDFVVTPVAATSRPK